MTSSATPNEPEAPAVRSDAARTAVEPPRVLPRARVAGALPFPSWMLALAVVPPGWFYVLRVARWHLTASTVLLMLCWGAIVAIGYWGIRMALAASAEGDEGWFTVRGQRDELEREKRSLVKALKEIEFDHQTGKLSAADAAALTASYRARAIEVIKSIEAETGVGASVRDQILAEVRARAAVDAKVKGKSTSRAKGKKETAA